MGSPVFGLLGSTSSFAFTPQTIGVGTLTGYFQAKSLTSLARSLPADSAARVTTSSAPPPWDPAAKTPDENALARRALADGRFVDRTLGEFSDIDAPRDQKRLFALHQGLKKLWAIAGEAEAGGVTDARRALLDRRFQEGLGQVKGFVADTPFDALVMRAGLDRETADAGVAILRGGETYTGGLAHEGAFDEPVASLAGAVAFTITARRPDGSDTVVDIDLADMGATPRTLDAVAAHINTALETAGLSTRFERVKLGEPDDNGVIAGQSFGLKIEGLSTEKLTLSAADASPAATLVGLSGSDDGARAGQVTRFSDLDAGAPLVAPSRRLEAYGGPVEDTTDDALASVRAFEAKTGAVIAPVAETSSADDGALALADVSVAAARATPDGGLVVALTSPGVLDGGPEARATGGDVTLAKYDSQGGLVWSRVLGAGEAARPADLAVTAEGAVIVTGTVSGALGDTLARGGDDAFVAKYDVDGTEAWVQRFGTSGQDTPARVSVDAAGAVFVSGATSGGIDGAVNAGGTDAFVRAFSDDGTPSWTRQMGGAGGDSAPAVAVSGGHVYVATVSDGVAVLEKFAATDATSPALWSHALGALDGGQIRAIAVDGANVYVTGSAGAGADLVADAGGGLGGRDAFVALVTDSGASAVRSATSLIGGAGDDAANDIQILNGAAYVAGDTRSDLATGDALATGQRALLARLDAGAVTWTQDVSGRDGAASGAAVALSATGASALDLLGLPTGAVSLRDSEAVTARTSARAGDSFTLRIDGGRAQTITLAADDTLQNLALRIQNTLLVAGKATATSSSDGAGLRIAPREGVRVTLERGPAGQDLLAALKLTPGEIEKPAEQDEDEIEIERYALGLPEALSLSDKEGATSARAAISAAMTAVRDAYRDLTIDPEIKRLLSGDSKPLGPPPAYLTAKIAAYQDALVRISNLT